MSIYVQSHARLLMPEHPLDHLDVGSDPVDGIGRWHLWLLGLLAWPVMFVGGTALTWWLFPFDSVCYGYRPFGRGADLWAGAKCGFGWGAVLAGIAAVLASLAVWLFVKSVHTRQDKARQVREAEFRTGP